jgi:hypothetical protein
MRGAFRRTTIIPHLHHVYRNLDDGVHSEGLPVRISGKTLMASADPSIHPLVAAFDIEGGSTTCRAIDASPRRSAASALAVLIAGAVFVLIPGRLGFSPALMTGMLTPLFDLMTAVDTPNNLVPSLHVTFAALILLGCAERASRPLAWIYRLW